MYPIIDKEKTGKRLEELMKLHNLTPADVSRYLSLSCVQTVYRWLRGNNIPSVDNLYALSQLFQVEVDEMLVGNRVRIRYDIVDLRMHRRFYYTSKLFEKRSA